MAYPTVTVAGGDLFALAAKYLGDAMQWGRFATLNADVLNNSVDPRLPAGIVLTLKIPPVIPNLIATAPAIGGGILGAPS